MSVIWIGSGRFAQTLWTPANITTSLWLDASDASTITLNGSTISQWSDKSGNSRHATQGTASEQPVYSIAARNGLNCITFDGVNDSLNVSTTIYQTLLPYQLFYVSARLGAGSGFDTYRPEISMLSGSNSDLGAFHYIKNTNLLGASYPFFPAWGAYDLSTGTAYITNQANILCFKSESPAFTFYRDGVSEGSSSTGSVPGSDFIGIKIGAQKQAARWSNIHMCEIVQVQSADTTLRQKTEGYLAHKWGLAANLPAGHPYKATPPYV